MKRKLILESADALAAGRTRLVTTLTPYAAKQFADAGLVYVDELQELSAEQLRTFVRSEKAYRNLMVALDRAEEGEHLLRDTVEVRSESGELLGEVPRGTIRQIAALNGTASALSFDSPAELKAALEAGERIDPQTEEVVPFGEIDIARYRLETEMALKQQAQAMMGREINGEGVPDEAQYAAFENRVELRVEQYKQDYDVAEWVVTDFQMLRQLAYFEMRLDAVQRAQARAVSGSKDAEASNKLRTEEAERLVGIIVKVRNELQVSLKARAERSKSTQADQVVTDLAKRGKTLMRERMSMWQHCGILQFLAFPIFPDGVITQTVRLRCSRCRKEESFTIVTTEMLDVYTEAGAFMPSDAPPGLFDQRI